MVVVAYRQFRNFDPPQILRLWNESGLGRGAATGISCDEFDGLVIAQTYFDPAGLIVATTDNRHLVGFVHVGFGADETKSRLCRKTGVICAVIVDPQYRRQGIGRELIRRAEEFLREAGAETIYGGGADPNDPFYAGLYGGSQPAGFLESDPAAAPFFQAMGYVPFERHLVFQRKLGPGGPEIMCVRMLNAKRQSKLAAATAYEPKDWWWSTRQGRLDSMQLGLMPKAGGSLLARVCVVGLDMYTTSWKMRAIGITGLHVSEHQRRKGYGQLLLDEVCRRVRDEMIQLAEAHAKETDTAAIAVIKSAGFQLVDAGVVYKKAAGAVPSTE
ncbi:GNAT family N-acetyltransferase [Schlesneria sp. T3-172]|uniref:GNAT family N-acetyltransferase n=1 Tax=Schlesneria sphaerica TaxID=3373610 RepID=UPI0037CBA91D